MKLSSYEFPYGKFFVGGYDNYFQTVEIEVFKVVYFFSLILIYYKNKIKNQK